MGFAPQLLDRLASDQKWRKEFQKVILNKCMFRPIRAEILWKTPPDGRFKTPTLIFVTLCRRPGNAQSSWSSAALSVVSREGNAVPLATDFIEVTGGG